MNKEMDELFDGNDPFDGPLWMEAERRAQAADAGVANLARAYVVFPMTWLERVLPLVRSPEQLVVAMLLYRHLRYDRAVPISNSEFEGLGVSRHAKYRTLARLERAGLVTLERTTGHSVRVRLL